MRRVSRVLLNSVSKRLCSFPYTEEKISCHEDDISSLSSLSPGGTSGKDNADWHALFSDGIVDQSYKSAFYMRVLEFYLLETTPTPHATYRCLMTNCQRNGFKSPQEMIRHLRSCTFFRDDQWFRCPTCDKDERFQTVSKRCPFSLGMLKLSQKFHQKFKDLLKSLAGSFSGSKTTPNQVSCHTHYHARPQEMSAIKSLYYELSSDPLPESFETIQPNQLTANKLDCLPCLALDQSSSPVELYSATVSQTGLSSADISPTAVSELSKSVSNYAQDEFQVSINSRLFTGDSSAFVENHSYMKPTHEDWPMFQATQLFELSTSSAIPTQNFPSQPSFHGNRGPPLTINTHYLEQNNIPTPAWGGEQTDSGGASWPPDPPDTPGMQEDMPSFGVYSSPTYGMNTSSPMDFEANSSPPATEKDGSIQNLQSFNNSSPLDSNGSPPSSEQSPTSELTPSRRCSYPGCSFAPRGKPENFAAYLRKHMSTHDRKVSHRCEHCNRAFTRRDNLRVHARKAHSGEIGPNTF